MIKKNINQFSKMKETLKNKIVIILSVLFISTPEFVFAHGHDAVVFSFYLVLF